MSNTSFRGIGFSGAPTRRMLKAQPVHSPLDLSLKMSSAIGSGLTATSFHRDNKSPRINRPAFSSYSNDEAPLDYLPIQSGRYELERVRPTPLYAKQTETRHSSRGSIGPLSEHQRKQASKPYLDDFAGLVFMSNNSAIRKHAKGERTSLGTPPVSGPVSSGECRKPCNSARHIGGGDPSSGVRSLDSSQYMQPPQYLESMVEDYSTGRDPVVDMYVKMMSDSVKPKIQSLLAKSRRYSDNLLDDSLTLQESGAKVLFSPKERRYQRERDRILSLPTASASTYHMDYVHEVFEADPHNKGRYIKYLNGVQQSNRQKSFLSPYRQNLSFVFDTMDRKMSLDVLRSAANSSRTYRVRAPSSTVDISHRADNPLNVSNTLASVQSPERAFLPSVARSAYSSVRSHRTNTANVARLSDVPSLLTIVDGAAISLCTPGVEEQLQTFHTRQEGLNRDVLAGLEKGSQFVLAPANHSFRVQKVSESVDRSSCYAAQRYTIVP